MTSGEQINDRVDASGQLRNNISYYGPSSVGKTAAQASWGSSSSPSDVEYFL